MDALRQIDGWGATVAAVAVLRDGEVLATRGPRGAALRWASISKPLAALAALIAAEEGVIDLDDAAGPERSTIRHLLAHASGLPPDDGPPLMPPGRRRIYSNAGIEAAAALVAERAGMSFPDYFSAALAGPLGLSGALNGSPAWGYTGPLDDLLKLGRELLAPTLVARETLDEAATVQFPGLVGVLPGFGRQEPNDWGLGLELRDAKSPHWTGSRNSPRTYGHFGRSGTFLWVDPDARLALGCLTDLDFGAWAVEAWPRLADSVLAAAGHADA